MVYEHHSRFLRLAIGLLYVAAAAACDNGGGTALSGFDVDAVGAASHGEVLAIAGRRGVAVSEQPLASSSTLLTSTPAQTVAVYGDLVATHSRDTNEVEVFDVATRTRLRATTSPTEWMIALAICETSVLLVGKDTWILPIADEADWVEVPGVKGLHAIAIGPDSFAVLHMTTVSRVGLARGAAEIEELFRAASGEDELALKLGTDGSGDRIATVGSEDARAYVRENGSWVRQMKYSFPAMLQPISVHIDGDRVIAVTYADPNEVSAEAWLINSSGQLIRRWDLVKRDTLIDCVFLPESRVLVGTLWQGGLVYWPLR